MAMSLVMTFASMAGTWHKADNGKWWFLNDDGYTWAANGWDYIDSDHDGWAEQYYFDEEGYLVTDQFISMGMWIPNTGERWNALVAKVDKEGRKVTEDGEVALTSVEYCLLENNREGHNPPKYYQYGEYKLYEGYTAYIGNGTVFDFEAYRGDELFMYPGYGIATATMLAAPYVGATAVWQIPDGATVIFEGNYNNAYALVSYQGMSGFIPIDYLSYYESQD